MQIQAALVQVEQVVVELVVKELMDLLVLQTLVVAVAVEPGLVVLLIDVVEQVDQESWS
tara:strand:+ start:709 stop:885 length:177 start_codon:yes stop_codon:yes gene_type:complete